MNTRHSLRVAPLTTSGIALVGASLFLVAPPGVPSITAASPAPQVQSHEVELTAAGGFIGTAIGFFISNGTPDHPNAGLLIGNGYSYSAIDAGTGGACADGKVCNGGNGGLMVGDGGNGLNGGKGGNVGFLAVGNAGNGGAGLDAVYNAAGIRTQAATAGGKGGKGGMFGNGGAGGAGGSDTNPYTGASKVAGATGADGGAGA